MNKKVKTALVIIGILIVLGGTALSKSKTKSETIIGGADGPTAIFVA